MRRRVAAALAALAVACAVPAAARPAPIDHAIRLIVNGQLLPRTPAPHTVDRGGRIVVPLGRVLASLGVPVSRHGSTIVALAAGKRVTLQVGSARATIDGVPVQLDAPVQTIGGISYVPLRFLSDVLGAAVAFNPAAHAVEVTSALVGHNPALERRSADGSTQIAGTVSALDMNSAPATLTVVRGSDVRTIAMTSGAEVTLQDVAARTSSSGTLADLRAGDAVTVVLRGDGRVASVIARYASQSGALAAVAGNTFVLDDGLIVTPDRTTETTLNGEPATVGDLLRGDRITVRSNPDTNEKRQIIAARAVAPAPQSSPAEVAIAAIEIGPADALRAGDTLDVTLRGTPGARATFDLGTYVTGIAMTEAEPGRYTGRYLVPAEVNFGPAVVAGNLALGPVRARRVEAGHLVAISTTPPQIVEIAPTNNQTVNNDRPSIFATYRSPSAIGIDPARVTIAVNGVDVTAAATLAEGFVTYSPATPLPDGKVSVVVGVSDRAGNVQSRSWSFTIRAH